MNNQNETQPIRKIIVATDFSRGSRHAFLFSLRLATKLGAEVVAIFVKDVDDLALALRQNISLRHSQLKNLKSIVNKLMEAKFKALLDETKPDRPIRFLIREGSPSQQIIRIAKKEKADLIVTGTRGRSLVSTLILGSTARELILNASCPVVTINEKIRISNR